MPPGPPKGYSHSPSKFNPGLQDKASRAAIWALILGIASWVLCGLFAAVPAWIVGKIEIKKIQSGMSSKAGMTMANVGMYLGIIQTIVVLLIIIPLILFFNLAFVSGFLKGILETLSR